MPLWDAVAMGLAGKGINPEFNGVPLINNSYNCYVGSVLAFYIGEGRVTAIYGGETKLVFDWESVLGKWAGGSEFKWLGDLKTARRLMGGGDTTLVLGPTNKLNYYGADLGISRARDAGKVDLIYKDLAVIPPAILATLALGFLGILATSLLLRYWWGYYGISSSKPQSEQEQLASVLIPMFEGLWLTLLYTVETIECCILGEGGIADSFLMFLGFAGQKADREAAAVAAAAALETVGVAGGEQADVDNLENVQVQIVADEQQVNEQADVTEANARSIMIAARLARFAPNG